MRELVQTHAVVAFGLSIFVDTAHAAGQAARPLGKSASYRVHTFNFTVLRDVSSGGL